MFSNITQSYDLSDATLEIFFMLLVAFLLGYILAMLIYRRQDTETTYVVSAPLKQKDNLKIVEGIGPKIESLLNDAGITSFADVVESGATGIQKVLDNAGPKYQMHNPTTWPDQAELAMQERWSELKEYQDLLNAGKQS